MRSLPSYNNSPESRASNDQASLIRGKLGTSLCLLLRWLHLRLSTRQPTPVQVPPLSTLVLRNPKPIEADEQKPAELQVVANRTSEIDDRWEIRAELAPEQVASVAFGARAKGESEYKFLGTADSPPYRVFPTRDTIPNAPTLEFKAIARDLFGKESTADVRVATSCPEAPCQESMKLTLT